MTIEKYTGLNIADRLEGIAKECYLACWNWMKNAWGNNVEFERMAYHVLLCAETRAYLYDKPPKLRYIRGTRPELEKITETVCTGAHTEREKALKILSYIRDLHKNAGGPEYRDYFYGGTEEELIKKNEWYCERVSRIMTALCEIAGMPGRIIFHVGSGHVTTEIYLEGKWAYFDPRFGRFFSDENNSFMSVEELVKNRKMIYNQSDEVNSFFDTDLWSFDYALHRYYHFCFNPDEIQCIGTYSLADADKYHFGWMPSPEDNMPAHLRRFKQRYTETGAMLLVK